MSERYEEGESGSPHHSKTEDDPENYKVQPPDKKKYEEEMDKLLNQIKDKEAETERLKSLGSLNVTNELQRIKAEKSAAIAQRKKIDQELEKVKKIIPEKMRQLGQVESSLIYKSEERINTAVQRLEWNLKVQPFKLKEEKKIVSEIDRLKRSKKTLVQYMALKQDIAGIRDMQRGMREERDAYFQAVGKLNAEEERLRRDIMSARTTQSVLKLQIDELHEAKRNLVASHKKQMEEFQDAKEKQRKGNWKKREEYKKSVITERRRQLFRVDVEVDKTVHDRYISWCNSLIKVLSRYNSLATQEPSSESLSPASSVEEPELAEEIDDGQYVLLKKPGESLEPAAGTRRPSKKNRRPRKQSSVKKVTLSPDMVQQLTELGLSAPNSISEVSQAIDSLRLKKILLEQEQQASEVASDAGISATESLMCEMSRQVSKTESFEGTADTNPGDQVYAEILHGCVGEQNDQPEGWEAAGAVGGSEVLSEILSPNSDSTVEGDAGSIASQSSVCDSSENAGHYVTRSGKARTRREVLPAEASERGLGMVKTSYLPTAQRQTSGMVVSSYVPPRDRTTDCLPNPRDRTTDCFRDKTTDCLPNPRDKTTDCLPNPRDRTTDRLPNPRDRTTDFLPNPRHRGPSKAVVPAIEAESPSLFAHHCSETGHQDAPSTSSCDFPALTPKRVSPPVSLSHTGNRSAWQVPANHSRPVQPANSILPASSPVQPRGTSAAIGQVQNVSFPALRSLSGLTLDGDDFPSLSESLHPSRRGSNVSTRSSGESSSKTEKLSHPLEPESLHLPQRGSNIPTRSSGESSGKTEQLSHPREPESGPHTSNQTTDLISPAPACARTVFHVSQSCPLQIVPVSLSIPPAPLTSQKCPEAPPQSDRLLSVSQIPSMDKSSTEKWVESSVAYIKDLIPEHCLDPITAVMTESTRL